MNPVELFILDRPVEEVRDTSDVRVLLSHRDDVDYPDCWHHPGGYLGGGERIMDAAERVAERDGVSPYAFVRGEAYEFPEPHAGSRTVHHGRWSSAARN